MISEGMISEAEMDVIPASPIRTKKKKRMRHRIVEENADDTTEDEDQPFMSPAHKDNSSGLLQSLPSSLHSNGERSVSRGKTSTPAKENLNGDNLFMLDDMSDVRLTCIEDKQKIILREVKEVRQDIKKLSEAQDEILRILTAQKKGRSRLAELSKDLKQVVRSAKKLVGKEQQLKWDLSKSYEASCNTSVTEAIKRYLTTKLPINGDDKENIDEAVKRHFTNEKTQFRRNHLPDQEGRARKQRREQRKRRKFADRKQETTILLKNCRPDGTTEKYLKEGTALYLKDMDCISSDESTEGRVGFRSKEKDRPAEAAKFFARLDKARETRVLNTPSLRNMSRVPRLPM